MEWKVTESFFANQQQIMPPVRQLIVQNKNFIGIIDASSPKAQGRHNNGITAEVMQEILYDVIARATHVSEPIDLMRKMNARIIGYYNQRGIFSEVLSQPELRMCANLLLINQETEELWIYGQGQYAIDGQLYRIKSPISQMIISLRRQIAKNYHLQGVDKATWLSRINADMLPFHVSASQFQNNLENQSPLAFGVVDGFEIPPQFIHRIDLKGVRQVAIASEYDEDISNMPERAGAKLLKLHKKAASAQGTRSQTSTAITHLVSHCYVKCERQSD